MPTREQCLREAARVLVSIAVRIETDRAAAARSHIDPEDGSRTP
jgi:hypothetical protein